MEPFTILCETCAARLKVTQPKAIGQKLACPKCNSMVQVVVPEGVTITPEETEDTASSFDFDDIEKILQKSPGKAAKVASSNSPPRPTASDAATGAPRSRSGDQPASQPEPATQHAPAPGEQWTSPAAKSRQKWVIAGAVAIGSLLLVFAVIGVIIGNSGSKQGDAANLAAGDSNAKATIPGTAENNPAKDTETPPSKTDPKQPTNNGAVSPETTPPISETSKDETATLDDGPDSVTRQPEMNNTPPVVPPAVSSEQSGQQPTNEPPPASNETPDDEAEQTRPNGLDSLLIGMDNRGDESVLNSNLGELANLLEKKGTSILEINDLAAVIRNSQMIGLPSYHFEKPVPFNPEQLERLQDPCAGVQYEDIPVLVALREISLITGVPFQLNVEAIASKNIDLATPVNFKLIDKNFIEVVREMLKPLELEVGFDGTKIPKIAPINHGVMTDVKYDLPKLHDPTDEKISKFMESIKVLIAPKTWTREENPATIQILDNQLVIHQTPENQAKIKDYLLKIQAGIQMTAGDQASTGVFKNRWVEARKKTGQPFASGFRTPVSLEAMLNQIQQVSQVNIVVDWESVLPTGWTPQTIVPAKIEENTVDEAIHQLVRTMGLTSRYIDSNTIEITTFKSAADSAELEVYSCHKILSGKMTPEALMQALEGALHFNANQLNNIRVVYEPECQCIIALAPQLVQRQIHAVLERLNVE